MIDRDRIHRIREDLAYDQGLASGISDDDWEDAPLESLPLLDPRKVCPDIVYLLDAVDQLTQQVTESEQRYDTLANAVRELQGAVDFGDTREWRIQVDRVNDVCRGIVGDVQDRGDYCRDLEKQLAIFEEDNKRLRQALPEDEELVALEKVLDSLVYGGPNHEIGRQWVRRLKILVEDYTLWSEA